MKTYINAAFAFLCLAGMFYFSGPVSFFCFVALFGVGLVGAMEIYALPAEKKKEVEMYIPIRPAIAETPVHLRAPRAVVNIYRPGLVPRRAVTGVNLSRKPLELSGSHRMTMNGNGRTRAQAQSGNYVEPDVFDQVGKRTAAKPVVSHDLELN